MNEQDLQKVEKELGVKIPSVYRQFLADFPEDLITDEDECIFHTAEQIIDSTKGSREYKEEEWKVGYTMDLIDVGWNGGSSVYCIKVADGGEKIHLFDHELGDLNPDETLSLQAFVEMVRSW